jgi:hypothetical protein
MVLMGGPSVTVSILVFCGSTLHSSGLCYRIFGSLQIIVLKFLHSPIFTPLLHNLYNNLFISQSLFILLYNCSHYSPDSVDNSVCCLSSFVENISVNLTLVSLILYYKYSVGERRQPCVHVLNETLL